jgi:asparagine synthase (glutamine-hydrolysing)
MRAIDEGPSWYGGLGHRRLSIIDLATGNQPMCDPSGRHWLSYNGEIYNYRELRRLLESDGVRFRTTSDTEVLLESLIRWGSEGLNRLEGMFAFAWWDSQERRLLLARDRFGIKPLYYAITAGVLAFASEIKALLELPILSRGLDRAALRDFLAYRYIPSPKTIYAQVSCLPQAHMLSIAIGQGPPASPQRWYALNAGAKRPISMDSAVEELDALLDTVCRDHLVSDVPVGVFLSGGLDSSSILAHSQANSAAPLRAVSVGFKGMEESKYNELEAASTIARHLGSDLKVVEVDSDLLDVLPGVIEALDEPMADISALPVLRMMQVARTEAKVMLSGDGGDEVFGGYERYIRTLAGSRTGAIRRLKAGILSALMGRSAHLMSLYLERVGVISLPQLKHLILPDFAAEAPPVPLDQRFELAQDRDPLTQWQHLDMQTYLVDDNLKKTDRMSMACSIEVRVPMVDRRVVEFGFSLPARLRIAGDRNKVVLRESLRRHLPACIANRGKMGFKVPLKIWMRQDEANDLIGEFAADTQPVWNVVRRSVVMQWLAEHRNGRKNHVDKLYSLIVLNAWLRHNNLPR